MTERVLLTAAGVSKNVPELLEHLQRRPLTPVALVPFRRLTSERPAEFQETETTTSIREPCRTQAFMRPVGGNASGRRPRSSSTRMISPCMISRGRSEPCQGRGIMSVATGKLCCIWCTPRSSAPRPGTAIFQGSRCSQGPTRVHTEERIAVWSRETGSRPSTFRETRVSLSIALRPAGGSPCVTSIAAAGPPVSSPSWPG